MKLVTGTLNFFWILPLIRSKDIPVTCLYSKECMLPCHSNYHDIIHWYKGQNALHSFFQGKDQMLYQYKEYKNRTSLLSTSKINEGNVSLLLKHIRIQDEGRYKCYSANKDKNEENFVVVSVEAPVKSVEITIRNDTVTCSTTEVYPRPTVSMSSDPPAKNPSYNHNELTDEKLFVVTSEFKIGNISDVYTYNCSIKNPNNKTLYTAMLKQQNISVENEVILPCPLTKNNSFILTFSTTFLSYDSKNPKQIHDEWKDKVSFSPEDGTVKLHNLNKEHMGTYTCITTTAQYITLTSNKQILSGNEDTFKCPVTKDQNYKTTLVFTSELLNYDSQTSKKQILDQWANKITFSPEESGGVKLSSLNQKQHSGTYTCEITTANTRYIIHTKVTLTGVRAHASILAIVISLLVLALVTFVIVIYVIKKKKLCCNKENQADKTLSADNSDGSELQRLKQESNGK